MTSLLVTDSQQFSTLITSFKSGKKCSLKKTPTLADKFAADTLSPIFTKLFNDSLVLGIFPNCFIAARITLFHKADTKKSVKNFRPVSSFPFSSKVFEKLVHSCTL